MSLRLATLLLATLLAGAGASAQTARLHVLVDSADVGAPFGVAVAVERQPGAQVVFAEPPPGQLRVARPLQFGDAEFVAMQRHPPASRGTARVDSAVYTAVVFALDEARVGPVAASVVLGGDTVMVVSPAARVPVRSWAPAGTEELHGPAPLATFPRGIWPWLVGAAAALAVLALLVVLARRRRRRRAPAPAPLAPGEEATQRLDALAASGDDGPAATHAFHVELSDALRTYLARTTAVPAREMTTRELEQALPRLDPPLPQEARVAMSRALRQADLAKFAGARPPREDRRQALEDARLAVDACEAERRRRSVEHSPPDADTPSDA